MSRSAAAGRAARLVVANDREILPPPNDREKFDPSGRGSFGRLPCRHNRHRNPGARAGAPGFATTSSLYAFDVDGDGDG